MASSPGPIPSMSEESPVGNMKTIDTRRPWLGSYDEGVPTSIDFEDLILTDYLRRAAENSPEQAAVIFMNSRLTYRELKEQVDRCAAGLSELGVKQGTRVAIHLPNIPQTVISVFAVLSLGAHCVLTSPLYVSREIEHQWNDAGCTHAIVADWLYQSRIVGIRKLLPVQHYVVTSIPEYLHFPLNVLATIKLMARKPPSFARVEAAPGVTFFKDLLKNTAEVPVTTINSDDIALLQYTGGTTGLSKGAVLTHRNVVSNVQQLNSWYLGIERGQETALSALPFFHVFGLVGALFLPVSAEAAMVLIPDPRDAKTLVRNIIRRKVTMMPAVPPLYAAICRELKGKKIALSHLKLCASGAAPLSKELALEFHELTGCPIVEGFGMTEVSLSTHANPTHGEQRIGSIGLPLPDTDAKLVDIEDPSQGVGNGEEGELWVRGPQVMQGYLDRPQETEEVMTDGWLSTGDVATMDSDGFFYLVGRKKDMILTSGYNVFPDEVDETLTRHPSVLEACSIGVPDDRRGEIVKSFLVLHPGHEFDEKHIMEHCRTNLAPYKLPRAFEIVKSLPRSGVLKLLRRTLRNREMGDPTGRS